MYRFSLSSVSLVDTTCEARSTSDGNARMIFIFVMYAYFILVTSLFDFEKLFKPQDENHDGPSSDDFDFDATQERASDSCDTYCSFLCR